MNNAPQEQKDPAPLHVRRGRVDSVDLYEVKDNELELLERGSPASIQLNFAIFLYSLAFASLTTLITATFNKTIYQTIYVVVTVVGFILGTYFLIMWNKARGSIAEIVKTIRARIPKESSKIPPTPESPTDKTGKGCEKPSG